MFGIAMSISVFAVNNKKAAKNFTKSLQAYFAAEAGVEDILLRLDNGLNWSNPYRLAVGDSSATITVSGIIGGSRAITSEGNSQDRIRKVQVAYELSTTQVQLHYGAQIGDAGLVMQNNSIVNGNIFSDGSVNAQAGSRIEGTVKVAGVGNSITGATISGDAHVNTCSNSGITGTLYAPVEPAPGAECAYGSFISQSPPNPLPLPIQQNEIDQWKAEAQNGGTIGTQSFSSGITILGPVKIVGNLAIDGSAQVILKGTVWVTGNINVANNAQVRLDSDYGSLSGIIIGDGTVTLQNNSISSGSGTAGSYLMYISTAALNPALIVKNLAVADVVYTSNGWIHIQNNAVLRQITGYGIEVENNAVITYEIGLADVDFTSGPGAAWLVASWREIE